MDIKQLLKQQADMISGLVKCLSSGDVDGAIDLLKSSADSVSEQIEKAENEPETTDPAEVTPPEGGEAGEDGGEKKPVEKTVVTLTKSQADALAIVESIGVEKLKKWADLWIGGSDLSDIMDQLTEATERLTKLEKSSKQAPEDAEQVKKSSLS